MKVSEIQNAVLGIVRTSSQQKPWRLTIQDPDSSEVIWVDLTQEIVDQIVGKFTSGLIIPKPL